MNDAHAKRPMSVPGPLSRRVFLKRAGLLALTIPSMSGLLAACGDDDATQAPAGDATVTPASAADTPETPVPALETSTITTTPPGGATPEATTPADATTATPGSQEPAAGEGQMGGVLRVALNTAPPNVDPQQSTAYITRVIMGSVTEGLFSLDEQYAVIPELANGFEASADGLNYTIELRNDVTFHDGNAMTADDVIASLDRWLAISTPGGAYSPSIGSITASDDATIEIEFSDAIGHLLIAALAFSYQAASIHPKSQMEEVGTDGTLSQPIGTGPFMLTHVDLDTEIRLQRFEDYSPRSEPPNGYGGQKIAYLDEVVFIPTPEASVRASALEAGDFEFVVSLARDDYERLDANPDVQMIIQFQGSTDLALNNAAGMFTNKQIRKAFQAALNPEELLLVAYGDPAFYRIDPGLWPQETAWWTDAGAEGNYNQNDPDRARSLLEEAGYDGSPIRWLSTEQGTEANRIAVAAQQQLEQAGFTLDIQIVDWATLLSRRRDPEVWDVFGTGFSIQPEPTQYLVFDCEWPAFWCDERKDELVEQLKLESDFERRFEIWEELHAYYWEESPVYKVGDYFNLHGATANVRGYAAMNQMFWYNVWLEE